MARLPQPGSDDGIWGAVLNDYLSQVHDSNGLLKDGVVTAATLASASFANGRVLTYDTSASGNLRWTTPATVTSVAMGGAISGQSSNATITDGAVTEPKLAIANTPASGQVLGWNGTSLAWQSAASSPVTSVNAQTGAVVLDKGDVGLADVDNTSDANKPISTATQAALDGKADTSAIPTTAAEVGADAAGAANAARDAAIAASAQRASNLSDLADATAARNNLGLGSAATTDAADYATAAQGAAAETAVQPSQLGTPVLALPEGDPVPAGTASGTVIVRYLA